jgi:hypothetical protein
VRDLTIILTVLNNGSEKKTVFKNSSMSHSRFTVTETVLVLDMETIPMAPAWVRTSMNLTHKEPSASNSGTCSSGKRIAQVSSSVTGVQCRTLKSFCKSFCFLDGCAYDEHDNGMVWVVVLDVDVDVGLDVAAQLMMM